MREGKGYIKKFKGAASRAEAIGSVDREKRSCGESTTSIFLVLISMISMKGRIIIEKALMLLLLFFVNRKN